MLKALILREFKTEWRNRNVLSGLLLYTFSTILLVYFLLNYGDTNDNVLSGLSRTILFWVILLFSTVNAISGSFFREPEGLFLYHYYTLKPEMYLVAKYIVNALLSFTLAIFSIVIFELLIPGHVAHVSLFLVVLIMGNLSFASIFTLMSSLASRAGAQSGVVPIIGFPIVVPVLIYISRLTVMALQPTFAWDMFIRDLGVLLSFNLILPILGIILFPYIWRE